MYRQVHTEEVEVRAVEKAVHQKRGMWLIRAPGCATDGDTVRLITRGIQCFRYDEFSQRVCAL